jgi:meso-butanediol dehydrogenase/(S,S)-butanediol dehydrogenase/diacetyl reductase
MSTAVVTWRGTEHRARRRAAAGGDGHAVAVNKAGGRAVAVPADVTDRDAVFAMVDRVAEELGTLDVMVANAGIAQVKTLLEVPPEDLETIFRVNVFGVVYCMQAAAKRFIAQGTKGSRGRRSRRGRRSTRGLPHRLAPGRG